MERIGVFVVEGDSDEAFQNLDVKVIGGGTTWHLMHLMLDALEELVERLDNDGLADGPVMKAALTASAGLLVLDQLAGQAVGDIASNN